MAGYRIEDAPTGRSRCRECSKLIAKGEPRFGQDDLNATWFHLACAAKGRPRAFKPFEKQARTMAGRVSSPVAAAGPARNPQLEAALIEDPDSAQARLVFADWLQSRGDPWGELIVLDHAGNQKAASALRRKHAASLMGGIAPRLFTWRRGFIDDVLVDSPKPAVAADLLRQVVALRTTALLRELRMPVYPDAALVDLVSELAPRSLRGLFFWISDALDGLRIPWLTTLTIMVDRNVPAGSLRGLLSGAGLPALTELGMYSTSNRYPLPTVFVTELATSPLGRRVKLDLRQGVLDAAGEQALAAARRAPG